MQFDHITIRAILADIEAALKPVAEKYGIKLSRPRGTFTASNFTTKVEGAAIGADGTAETKEAVAFKRYAKLYGFEPEDLGKTFESRGTKHCISGLNPAARTMPVLAMRHDGKMFKFPTEVVLRALGKPVHPTFS